MVVVSRSPEVTGLLSLAASILRCVWSRTNTCSHAKRKLKAYNSCTELGSTSAYLWRNLSSRSMTSLLAARAIGFMAAESLTKIIEQTIQGRPPRDAKKCHATSLGATRATLNTQMPPLRRPAAESIDFNPQTERKWRRTGCDGPSRPSK